MNTPRPFSWKARARSFKYAFKGIAMLFTTEHNAWIHASAATIVIVAGVALSISTIEWAIIMLTIGAVVSAEAANSAIEALADKVCKTHDPLIGRAKDIAAAAVLMMAFAALAVGLIIFIPKIINLLV